MIVVDTNVVSALMGSTADQRVVSWVDARAEPLAVTVITVHEVLEGIALLPPGRRRTALRLSFEETLDCLCNRVLPFATATASISSEIRAMRSAAGRPLELGDCLIAAIAIEHGARLATRNTRDFDGLPLLLLDPWAD